MRPYFLVFKIPMELSIIIVNYKTKKLTLQCIKSIYDNKPRVNFEVIVVDNSSEMNKSSQYVLIGNRENVGFAKANNQGIDRAKGKYILLLNSDTKVVGRAIDTLYKYAKSDFKIGGVGAKLLNANGSVQPSAFYLPSTLRTIRAYWFNEKYLIEKYIPKAKGPVQVESLVMAAFVITPNALAKVGKLNEKYFMYFEDLDYCRKLKRAGLKVVYLPSAEVVHYHGSSGKNLADDKDQWRRLIPSSKIYHGLLGYYLTYFVAWSHRQWSRILKLVS